MWKNRLSVLIILLIILLAALWVTSMWSRSVPYNNNNWLRGGSDQ